jgi:hypothetical protein
LGARHWEEADTRVGDPVGALAAIAIGVVETAIRLYREMATFQDLV